LAEGAGDVWSKAEAWTVVKDIDRHVAPVPRIGLNPDDAAKAIGISKKMLYDLKNAGEIPYTEAGPQTFVFDPRDLEAWLVRNKKTKGPQGEQHGQH
jgi:hypothetical protein